MISPLRLRTAGLASRRARPPRKQRNCPQIRASFAASRGKKRTRAAPSDRSPSRWPRAWSPLSTGCPGPFQAQPPAQPDKRGRPFLPVLVPRLARGRLAAGAPAMAWPGPDQPAGPAGEPGAGL